jgi:hypothetical protein
MKDKNGNAQSQEVINKILRLCMKKQFHTNPRAFCRQWFGLERTHQNGHLCYTKEQILEIECEYGYRERCIRLMSKILKIKSNTIQRWGKGVSFDKIPPEQREKYEACLGYFNLIRLILICIYELDQEILEKLLTKIENSQNCK